MGSNKSKLNNSSPVIIITNDDISAESTVQASVNNENESEDEYIECEDEFEDLANDMKYLISLNDETAENAQVAVFKNDDVIDNVVTIHATTSQNRLRFSSKQTESDDEDEDELPEVRKERQKKLMDEFHEEMHKKREMRQDAIRKMREDLIDLRDKLSNEKEINEQLRETLENSGNKTMENLSDENIKLKSELAECQIFLQTSNSENITMSLENKALKDHVRSLKEVQSACKEMLKIREEQNNVLKAKLTEIEEQFQDKETKLMSTDLQQEYHRQLENIRNMKELYEERANILAQERDEAKQKLEEKEHDLLTEIEKYNAFYNQMRKNL